MTNIITILLSILMLINGNLDNVATEESIYKYLSPDHQSVSDFIVDNLSMFTDEYNKQLSPGDEKFNATSCEWSTLVFVETSNQIGTYLDFDGNNGYMIIVDDYAVIAFETTGDLDLIRGMDNLHYSIYDGFLYVDDTGELVPLYHQIMDEANWNEYNKTILESYAGQSSGSDGTIYNTDLFVKDKYGSGYRLYKQNSLSNYQYVSQYDLSIYYNIKNGKQYSEGNCSLSSVYSLMNYLQSSSIYSKLPSSSTTTNHYATKDKFYDKYNNKNNYIIIKVKRLPKLYLSIRNYAVNKFGYEVSGTNPFNIVTMIEKVGKQYNCNIDASHILFWTFNKQVVDEIDAGYPTIWNMANSTTYGSHSTVVTGYKIYRKTRSFLGLKFYSYVNLMQLNDNWSPHAQYFDFTHYYLFGSFIKVR